MELWIRSQDRTILTKVNNLFVCNYYDKYVISNYYNEYPNDDNTIPYDLYIYGFYETKERALEVLDEIQQALLINDKYDYTQPPTVSNVNYNLIFEMPKE